MNKLLKFGLCSLIMIVIFIVSSSLIYAENVNWSKFNTGCDTITIVNVIPTLTETNQQIPINSTLLEIPLTSDGIKVYDSRNDVYMDWVNISDIIWINTSVSRGITKTFQIATGTSCGDAPSSKGDIFLYYNGFNSQADINNFGNAVNVGTWTYNTTYASEGTGSARSAVSGESQKRHQFSFNMTNKTVSRDMYVINDNFVGGTTFGTLVRGSGGFIRLAHVYSTSSTKWVAYYYNGTIDSGNRDTGNALPSNNQWVNTKTKINDTAISWYANDQLILSNTTGQITASNISQLELYVNGKAALFDNVYIYTDYGSDNPTVSFNSVYYKGQDIYKSGSLYNTTSLSGIENNFIVNITYNTSVISQVSKVDIIFNNAANTMTKDATYAGTDTSTSTFSKVLTAPDTSGDYTFYFNVSFIYLNLSTGYTNFSGGTQTVSPINLSFNCLTEGNKHISLFFQFYNEETLGLLDNASISATLKIASIPFGNEVNFSYTINNTNNLSVCLVSNITYYITEGVIQYEKSGYDVNRYYFYNQKLSGDTQNNISLYLLNQSYAVGTTIIIKDDFGDYIANEYIEAWRYYPSDNQFRLTRMGKTGSLGSDYFYLRWYDTKYLFKTKKLDYSTQEETIATSPLIYKILPTSFTELIKGFNDVSISLYFDNSSLWVATYNDPEGELSGACLVVELMENISKTEVCHTCATGSSNVILCSVPDNRSNYYAYVYGKINPTQGIISAYFFGKESFSTQLGTTGYFLALFLITTSLIIGIAIGGAAIGFILTVVSLIAISWMQLIPDVIIIGGGIGLAVVLLIMAILTRN